MSPPLCPRRPLPFRHPELDSGSMAQGCGVNPWMLKRVQHDD